MQKSRYLCKTLIYTTFQKSVLNSECTNFFLQFFLCFALKRIRDTMHEIIKSFNLDNVSRACMCRYCILQRIIGICCLQIRIVTASCYLTRKAGGGSIPARLAWYESTFRMDEGPESYVNRRSERGADKSGEEGVESIFPLERRIYAISVVRYMWDSLFGAIFVVR